MAAIATGVGGRMAHLTGELTAMLKVHCRRIRPAQTLAWQDSQEGTWRPE
jgi:hypothetical protein